MMLFACLQTCFPSLKRHSSIHVHSNLGPRAFFAFKMADRAEKPLHKTARNSLKIVEYFATWHNEMAFSKVLFSDWQWCLSCCNLKPRHFIMFHVTKGSRMFGVFWQSCPGFSRHFVTEKALGRLYTSKLHVNDMKLVCFSSDLF